MGNPANLACVRWAKRSELAAVGLTWGNGGVAASRRARNHLCGIRATCRFNAAAMRSTVSSVTPGSLWFQSLERSLRPIPGWRQPTEFAAHCLRRLPDEDNPRRADTLRSPGAVLQYRRRRSEFACAGMETRVAGCFVQWLIFWQNRHAAMGVGECRIGSDWQDL